MTHHPILVSTKTLGTIDLTSGIVNKTFRIKVYGMVKGRHMDTLVGLCGLGEVVKHDYGLLVHILVHAFNCPKDIYRYKMYKGATITFYRK